jgi:O-antigen/teichoic acid export membrane protein
MERKTSSERDRSGGVVLANAGWLYLDQGIRGVFSLVAFSFVARHLGPEQYGVLSFALAFPALFLPMATLGLDFVVVKELVRRPGDTEKILGTAALMLAVAAVAALALAVMGLGWLDANHPARPLIWWTMGGVLAQPFQLVDFYFQSRIASRFAVMARSATNLAGNGARLGLVMLDGRPVWFAAVTLVEAAVLCAGLVAAYRAGGGQRIRPWKNADRGEAVRMWLAAWPLMAGGFAMALYLRFDQLLLERLAGAEVLGVYAAGVKLGDVTQFVTYALILSYFPRFVAAHAEGPEVFAAAREKFFGRITWVAIVVAIGVTAAAPWITGGLLGAHYAGSAGVLVLMAWANVFAAQIGVRGKWFLLEGWQVHSLWLFAWGAVSHLAGVWLLAPRYGALGAAASFCAAQAMMALVAPLVTAKTRLAAVMAWRSFSPARIWS